MVGPQQSGCRCIRVRWCQRINLSKQLKTALDNVFDHTLVGQSILQNHAVSCTFAYILQKFTGTLTAYFLGLNMPERFHDYTNPRVLKFVDSVGMRYSMTYWSYLAMLLQYRWCILIRMSKNWNNPMNVHLLLHWRNSKHTRYIIDCRQLMTVDPFVVVIILTNIYI